MKKVIENTGNAFGSGQDKSAQKSLKDTLSLQYVSSYCIISVLVHPKKGSSKEDGEYMSGGYTWACVLLHERNTGKTMKIGTCALQPLDKDESASVTA